MGLNWGMQGAWKVGLLVVVFVGLVLGAYQVLGKALFAPKTDRYFAVFEDATGVNVGGPVLLAGVRIGSVERIELIEGRLAKLTLAIDSRQRIPAGTGASVPTPLIGFGDNPVVLTAPVEAAAGTIEPSSTIVGSRLSPLAGMFPELQTSVEELNKTLAAARELVSDRELRDSLQSLLKTADQTVRNFGALASNAQGMVSENRVAIRSAMHSLSATLSDVREGARIATQLLRDDKWKKQAEELLGNLNQTAQKAQELLASVHELATDPRLRDPVHGALANVQSMTETGTRIAANTEEISKNGITISKNVEELTKKANELADQAKDVLQKVQQFFERVPKAPGVSGVEAEMSLIRQTDLDRWRTDVEGTTSYGDGKLVFGLYDAFETNKLSLQYARNQGKAVRYRYGIYASKPSAGVDLLIAPRLSLRGDLYDINDPTLDVRARIDFGKGILGWLGIEKAFGKNSFVAGFGVRK